MFLLRRCAVLAATRNYPVCLPSTSSYCSSSHTTVVVTNDNEAPIKISDSCVEQLTKVSSVGECLRVTVDSGGCSGFEYKFALDSNVGSDDTIFERGGAKIVVDQLSLEFMRGSTVDFHQELIRAAFRISDNPLAEKGCSCGSSFAVKDE